MTQDGIKKIIIALSSAYNRHDYLSAECVEVYTNALADCSDNAVFDAVSRLIKTLKYPPTLADIREAVAEDVLADNGTLPPTAALEKAMTAIKRFGSYRGREAREWIDSEAIWRTIRECGTWGEVCGMNSEVFSAQFERRYAARCSEALKEIQAPREERKQLQAETPRLIEGE